MIAALICVISIAAFFQFFVSYCRSILASTRNIEVSDRIREITGITDRDVAAGDFIRLVQLVQLCPERADDQNEIRAVGTYYTMLDFVGRISRSLIPAVAAWTEQERRSCSHFAAVALDRRISYSRDLFLQQASNRP